MRFRCRDTHRVALPAPTPVMATETSPAFPLLAPLIQILRACRGPGVGTVVRCRDTHRVALPAPTPVMATETWFRV